MKVPFFKSYRLFVVMLWFILTVTLFAKTVIQMPVPGTVLLTSSFMISAYFTTRYLNDTLLTKALKKGEMGLFAFQFAIATLLLTLVFTLILEGVYWLETVGVLQSSQLISGSHELFFIEYVYQLTSALVLIAAFCGLKFWQEHTEIWQEHAKLKQTHLEDQLRILQDQINPHSMFNILNHIHILMQKDVALASDLLMRFSDILRYQLYECNRESVLLEKEVRYLKDVVAVERMRWGKELSVHDVWNVENGKKEISPLLLIPFVENAFKHVSRLPSENGYVSIQLNQTDNTLQFQVENSKSVYMQVTGNNNSGLGLENAQKRLHILYPQKHTLLIQATDTKYKIMLNITL